MIYILILIVIALDQITKYWAINSLQYIGEIPIIQNVFHLTYVENIGAAFGILPNQRLFFIIAKLIAVIGLLIFLYKNKEMHSILRIGILFIIAGAVGNLIDRVRFGYVVDFFDFRIWPVFNIADMSIILGAILVSYIILRYDSIKPKEL
ncbi:signal peptidase II [Alkaliphilus peptidifermentans]|uniref:Lipoprotein signal peptidase n=1 Tax=Alkaliphilus peptidifermentans DSM 18978 TaxID=1120976 RepID=A0A1G5B9D8_9FIRM|nr:signal peptidase II [Alkaliphilus peptidifermentans]SCX86777.1 signal peptidase II [Alkaliphilus peptidifermentans DSM 18978]